jgi:glyoxylase-like metal-dependent hydrolase (beta-lactamase superfamily II)
MEPVPVVDEGLGNSSYLLDLGDGRAAVVDPERDPHPYLARADAGGLTVAFAVETHVHADFVTGTRELAAQGPRSWSPRRPVSGSTTAACATASGSTSAGWHWRRSRPRGTPRSIWAASNCVEHAYTSATVDGTVELTFWTETRSVCVEIVDHGAWRTPTGSPPDAVGGSRSCGDSSPWS